MYMCMCMCVYVCVCLGCENGNVCVYGSRRMCMCDLLGLVIDVFCVMCMCMFLV